MFSHVPVCVLLPVVDIIEPSEEVRRVKGTLVGALAQVDLKLDPQLPPLVRPRRALA